MKNSIECPGKPANKKIEYHVIGLNLMKERERIAYLISHKNS